MSSILVLSFSEIGEKVAEELWRPIVGFPNYAVSDHGRVKNLKFDRVLSAHTTSYGLKQVILRHGGKSYGRLVHRLVAEAFISGYEDHLHVKHVDEERKDDNSPRNLRFRRGQRLGVLRAGNQYIETRRVLVVETGQVFRTVRDAARYLNIDISSIYKVLRGERQKCYGLTFEFHVSSE